MTTGSKVFDWVNPDWFNPATWPHDAIASVVGVGTLATAVATLWVSVRMPRETAKGAGSSYRPLMVAELMPPDKPKLPAVLRIANDGNAVARDVEVTFSPPLPEPNLKGYKNRVIDGVQVRKTLMETVHDMFDGRVFSSWTPGREIAVDFWALPRDFTSDSNSAEGVPPRQGLTVKYKDSGGYAYTDEYVLDVAQVMGASWSTTERQTVVTHYPSDWSNRARLNKDNSKEH